MCEQTAPPPREFAVERKAPAKHSFRLMTWNIHQGWGPDPEGRPDQWTQMLHAIAKHSPDVVLMQETVKGKDTNFGVEDTYHGEDVADMLEAFSAFAPNLRVWSYYPLLEREESWLFGNATVSKQPFQQVESFPLSDNRTVLVTTVAGTQIVNLHFTAADHPAARLEAIELLRGIRLDVPTVIAGDFNARVFDTPLAVFDEAGYKHCADFGVDHVLLSPHFRCAFVELTDDELSDHGRIIVDILPVN